MQASLLGAAGRVDTETARSLRLSAYSTHSALPEIQPDPSSDQPSSNSHQPYSSSIQPFTGPDQPYSSSDHPSSSSLSASSSFTHSADRPVQPFNSQASPPQASLSHRFGDLSRHQHLSVCESSLDGDQHQSCMYQRPSMHIPFSANAHALSSAPASTSNPGSSGFGVCTSSSDVSHLALSSNRGTSASCSASGSSSHMGGHMGRTTSVGCNSSASCSHMGRGRAVRRGPVPRSWRLHAVQRSGTAESLVTHEPAASTSASDAASDAASGDDATSGARDRYAVLADQLVVTGSISEDDDDLFPDQTSTSSRDGESRSQATIPQGNGSSALSSKALNESTISLDLADLPVPPVQLPKPQRSIDVTSSSDADDAVPTQPKSGGSQRSGKAQKSPREARDRSAAAQGTAGGPLPTPKPAPLRSGDRFWPRKANAAQAGSRKARGSRPSLTQSGEASDSGQHICSGAVTQLAF